MPENLEGISFATCYKASPYPGLGITLACVLATPEYTASVHRLMALFDECVRQVRKPKLYITNRRDEDHDLR